MDKNSYDKIINSASKILNIDKEKIKNAGESKDVSALLKNMSEKDSEKIQSILGNPDATQKILASEQAQAIIKKLMNK